MAIVLWIIILGCGIVGFHFLLGRKYPTVGGFQEIHYIRTSDLWTIRLLRVCPSHGKKGEPVILCHGGMANALTYLMPKGKGLASFLAREGYDCWLLEIRGRKSSTPPFGFSYADATFEDILKRDIPALIQYIRRQTGYNRVHWIGHSMGGVLLYAIEQMQGATGIHDGVTIASPVAFKDVNIKRGALHPVVMKAILFARPLVSYAITMTAPFARVLPPVKVFMNPSNMPQGVMEHFVFRGVELCQPRILQLLYHWASTGTCKIEIDGEELDIGSGLSRIKIPLLVISGGADPFAPLSAIEPFYESLPGKDKQLLFLSRAKEASADYGHLDLLFGPKAQEEVYVPIVQWMKKHPIRERYKEKKDTIPIPATVKIVEISSAGSRERSEDSLEEIDETVKISMTVGKSEDDKATKEDISSVENSNEETFLEKTSVTKKKTVVKKKSAVRKKTVTSKTKKTNSQEKNKSSSKVKKSTVKNSTKRRK